MKPIVRAGRMKPVHSDIRGPLFVEAMKRQKQGIDILKLNTGNPATFGFGLPDSIKNALMEHMQDGIGYCDFKGMPQARQAICDYETSKGIKGITSDDVFIGNGVSEVVSVMKSPTGIRISRISEARSQIRQKQSLSSIQITRPVYSIQRNSFLRSSRLQENPDF